MIIVPSAGKDSRHVLDRRTSFQISVQPIWHSRLFCLKGRAEKTAASHRKNIEHALFSSWYMEQNETETQGRGGTLNFSPTRTCAARASV